MTIWERVAAALEDAGIAGDVPIAANVLLQASGEELPDTYLVYFLVADPPRQHADDAETLKVSRVQVSAYSLSGLATLPDVTGAMLAAGFTRGPSRELPRSPLTGHFGLAMDFFCLEELPGEPESI